jgi:maleylacetate reductase
MPPSFIHDAPLQRVVFGAGSIARIADEAARLGMSRALVVATPGSGARLGGRVAELLGSRSAGVHAQAVIHVPRAVAEAGLAAAEAARADGLVAAGGGSAVGLAKMIARDTGLPIVALPTTYSGSEATPIWGTSEGERKTTGRDVKVLPRVIVYDPELTLGLPPAVTAASAMNAIAHCVEGLYAREANPMMSLLAAEGIQTMARALPIVTAQPGNLEARTNAFYAAWLAGVVLGSVGMAVHHNISHVLGGSFGLTHADVHTVVLPHAVAFNRDAAPEAMRIIAEALGAKDAAQGLYDLEVRIGAPTSLKQIGMKEDQLDRAAQIITEHPYFNPRPVEYGPIRRLLENAYEGAGKF